MVADTPFTLSTLPKPEGGEKLYAVIGDPVKHSLSPFMHNAAFKALALNSRYVKVRLAPEELKDGVEKMKAFGYSGWNVTVPHKTAMYESLDPANQCSPEARLTRAVNTVLNTDGSLHGFSTDGRGWWDATEEAFGLKPETCRLLLIGAGGSGQSLALFAAYHAGQFKTRAAITLTNRTPGKAHDLARLVSARPEGASCAVAESPEEIAAAVADAHLIVNTTSLGLQTADAAPIALPPDLSGKYVYDLIYNPAETAFLRAAKAAGAKTANGLSMLLWQGIHAFSHWHPGLTLEQRGTACGAMRRALEEATGQTLSARGQAG